MAKQKISNIAKELNVGLPNIFEFLRKHNIEIVESPNSRVEDSVVAMLTHHFQPDRELKTRSDQQTSDRRQLRADARAQAPARSAEPDLAHTPSDLAQKPRILGKIELDPKGNPVKPEPKPQPKPAPKPQPKAAPAPAPEIEKNRNLRLWKHRKPSLRPQPSRRLKLRPRPQRLHRSKRKNPHNPSPRHWQPINPRPKPQHRRLRQQNRAVPLRQNPKCLQPAARPACKVR